MPDIETRAVKEHLTCWEYTKCGSDKDASCPTVVQRYGRACWLVAGTLNGSEPTCKKIKNISCCKSCDFYQKVKQSKAAQYNIAKKWEVTASRSQTGAGLPGPSRSV